MGPNVTLSNGNLDAISTSGWRWAKGTIAVTSGKWYWEVTHTNGGADNLFVGITKTQFRNFTYDLTAAYADSYNVYGYTSNAGLKEGQSLAASYGSAFQTAGDIVGVALDMNAGTITFYKNGVSQGVAFSSITSEVCPAWGGNGGSISAANLNFGQRAFAYTAPSGFKALCTQNLPAPLVAKSNTVFDVITYTGTGATQTISGLGFSPDLVWIKGRSIAELHLISDSVRGVPKNLYPNLTNAEDTAPYLTALTSDGFTIQTAPIVNSNSNTYVGWTWDAGTSTVSNTQGSITSQVRANPSAGFSVVTYSFASAPTVGHGLGAAPSLIIAKSRTAAVDWVVYHRSLGKDNVLLLNSTGAAINIANYWGTSEPSSTVFGTYGTGGNSNNQGDMVAYCFAPVVGYTSAGSYTGNGSADGPFVYTSMRPRWILLKRTDSTGNWTILDTAREGYNVDNDPLFPNLADAEGTADLADILSNGFKLRSTDASVNASGGTYIYYAISEAAFQYARAR
jgi:hypothetical protein